MKRDARKRREFTLTYNEAKSHIENILNTEGGINDNDNLLELGLSSLQIMKSVAIWRKMGSTVTFSQLISSPYLGKWWELMEKNRSNDTFSSTIKSEEVDEDVKIDMYAPFALTDVQYAYWIGRCHGQYLGNVGCHGYMEFDGEGVDPDKLGQAWLRLQQHHPMLRARFTENGQAVLKEPKHGQLIVHDLREKGSEVHTHLEKIRNQLSHRLLNVEDGQVAGLQLALLPDRKTRIYFDIDLLVADVTSFQIILRDLAALYVRDALPKAPKEWNFAEYLYREKKAKAGETQKARKYWTERLKNISGAPELPLAKSPEQVEFPKFKRRKVFIEPEKWEKLKSMSKACQITPAMVLMTLYGRVLHKWSENNKFLINIPLFNRDVQEGGVDEVVADFTTLLLMELDFEILRSFIEQGRMVQDQFHQDMEHVAYSAIQIQRDYARLYPGAKTMAPVVFSYNVGIPLINEEFQGALGDMTYMVSQTPQVWLDFQLYDIDGGLLLVWDGVDELFPANMLDDMLKTYERTLHWLIEKEENWSKAPAITLDHQLQVRGEYIELDPALPKESIHAAFFAMAKGNPERIAVIDPAAGKELSYGELCRNTLSIARYLQDQGLKQGERVGILLDRGYHQIVAILGVLAAGGVYVPIDIQQPNSRKEVIYHKASINRVIIDKKSGQEASVQVVCVNIEDALQAEPLSEPVLADSDESAYVIFTSGSTGEPKGVEIAHGAALNTITDINKKYDVGENDRVLTVSAIDFDLSVYDIFGLLGAGGALVLIATEQRREAAQWLGLMQKYKVTIWNTVPVLFDMLMLEAQGSNVRLDDCRLVCLSGDWIGLDLPVRLKDQMPNARMIAMGGATEGSIWSNYFEVETPLPHEWKSIPYGYPLANQKYRVVDSWNEDCPDWVAGELWIGGDGVAKGYIGAPDETGDRFLTDNEERWYRTGDYGRYWPDGIIEFLGRKDQQVKIRGHRIELEEIEASIKDHSEIKQSVVLPLGEGKNRYLAGFLIPEHEQSKAIFSAMSSDTEKTKKVTERLKESAETFCKQEDVDQKAVEDFTAYEKAADELALFYICRMLLEIQVPAMSGDRYELSEIYHKCRIAEKYQGLVKQWYQFLEDAGIVKQLNFDYYENTESFDQREKPDWKDAGIRKFINQFTDNGTALLKGEVDPLTLVYTKEGQTPDAFAQKTAGTSQKNRLGIKLIKEGVQELSQVKECVRILELGARSLKTTKELLTQLDSVNVSYTCTDFSKYFEEQFKETFTGYSNVRYRDFNQNQNPLFQRFESHHYDVIIANNSLHRALDLKLTLAYLQELMSLDGILFVIEITKNTAIQLITTAFLEDGFSHFLDKRKESAKPLLSSEEWIDQMRTAGFGRGQAFPGKAYKLNSFRQHIIVGTAGGGKKQFLQERLESYLQEKLPDYMIPATYFVLNELPVTDNGKIDRKVLRSFGQGPKIATKIKKEPQTEMEIKIAAVWQRILKQSQVSLTDSFYDLGGDSLLATQLIVEHKKALNMDISLETLFTYPILADFVKALQNQKSSVCEELPPVVINKEDRYKPFPLTDIQQSYWIGRSGLYSLGDVSTHCYFEMESEILDTDAMNHAWNRLIQAHPMMRAVVLEDGQSQVIKESVPEYKICEYDVTAKQNQQVDAHLQHIRKEMSHQIFDTSVWPLFDVRVSKCDLGKMILHIGFDNIIFDGFSMFHLLGEWSRLYKDPQAILPQLELTFRDYVLAVEEIRKSSRYEKDLEYWKKRAASLPAAPQLPLAKQSDELAKQEFTRFETRLSPQQWQTLQDLAGQHQLTPSVVLMAAYAEVLGTYGKSQKFTLNLTRFNRLDLHPDVSELIGDFSSLTLLEVDNHSGSTFGDRCQKLQEQLWQDLDHPHVSGIVVEREIKRLSGNRQDITMPVVFTSALGVNKGSDDPVHYFGKIIYGISQTPQVWLDHQVSVQEGELVLAWDALCELFPDGMIAKMFQVYKNILQKIVSDELTWQKTGASLVDVPGKEIKEEANRTDYAASTETLLSLFEKQVQNNDSREAVITTGKTVTYGELNKRANAVAELLIKEGVKPNTLVAVVMEKGWEQIVAVMAIFKANAAYMPVDVSNPEERINTLLEKGKVCVALIQSKFQLETPEQIKKIAVDLQGELELVSNLPKATPSDLAYVIFTSGSTGQPKGVMIDHKGAVNTINDINRRFQVSKTDSAIGLSNLNFDLSVYDIFGLLAVGGALVLPDADKVKNPDHWISLIKQHNITLWNTVPMFMQMLMEHLSTGEDSLLSDAPRIALLSGDWIPMSLPDRMRNEFKGIDIISLGGATEASIWSNMFRVGELDPRWKSIPYGKPLANQRFYILNELMQECPIWVPGDLYIGGDGVALGYWDEKEKTEASFITHPHSGGRIYKTGDLGRYFPDGNIEFLGRGDLQVKVGGYRIELGEIETNIKQLKGIKNAVVTLGKNNENPYLIGHLFLDSEKESSFVQTLTAEEGEDSNCFMRLADAVQEKNQHIETPLSPNEMLHFTEVVELLSTAALCSYLNALDICREKKETYTLTEILQISEITNRYHVLLETWLERLVQKGILTRSEQGYRGLEGLSEKANALKKEGLARPLSAYQQRVDTLRFDLFSSQEMCVKMLRGQLEAISVLTNDMGFLTPDKLGDYNLGQQYISSCLSNALKSIVEQNTNQTFNVLELGTRAGHGTREYAKVIEGRGEYVYTDESELFLERKQQEIGENTISYKQYNFEISPTEQNLSLHHYDLIVAENTLHRSKDLHKSLENLKKMLRPNGLLIFSESTVNATLLLVTVAFFEDGYQDIADERKEAHLPLLSHEKWQDLVYEHHFSEFSFWPNKESPFENIGQHLMIAKAPEQISQFSQDNFIETLGKKIPDYMVPQSYVIHEQFPLSANGKVDRKQLSLIEPEKRNMKQTEQIKPETKIQKELSEIWKVILQVESPGITDNFFNKGGDSLKAIQFVNTAKENYGYNLALDDLFEGPTIREISENIESNTGEAALQEDNFVTGAI